MAVGGGIFEFLLQVVKSVVFSAGGESKFQNVCLRVRGGHAASKTNESLKQKSNFQNSFGVLCPINNTDIDLEAGIKMFLHV